MPAPWFEDEIAQSLAPLLPGIGVEVVAEIDSTNTELMRRARDGRSAAVLLVAERGSRSRPPAWLKEWRPGVTPGEVLREIAAPLVRDVLLFSGSGFVPFAARFAARDVLRGRDVRLSDGTEGHCEGVGWGGELM